MAKERSFRVFVIYALIFQFMIIAAMNNSIEKSNLTVIQDYTPRESVVQIMVSYSDSADPESFLPSYTGTGTAIATKGDTVYVLTARHVCLPYSPLLTYLSGLEQETEIQNSTGEYHKADIVLVSDYEDICVVSYETPDASAMSLGRFAKKPPYLDEKVMLYAAPAGFYVPSAITQFSGVHAGVVRLEGGISGVYTIPATGGSSGGAILNGRGEIVGVLHSALAEFHHITLATTHQSLINFIEELEVQEKISILD